MEYNIIVRKSFFMKDDECMELNYKLTNTDKSIQDIIQGWVDDGYSVSNEHGDEL